MANELEPVWIPVDCRPQPGETLRAFAQGPLPDAKSLWPTARMPPGLAGESDAALLALQNECLLLQNARLSEAYSQALQTLSMQGKATVTEPEASLPRLPALLHPHLGESGGKGSRQACSVASTASGESEDELKTTVKTTVIMKKVPKSFTRPMLLSLLNNNGFKAKYDFLYLPVDFDRKHGTGCAFINFISQEVAETFMAHFHGYEDWGVQCSETKVADVSWSSACQGRQAHIERYRHSPVMHPSVPDEFKPMLFRDGRRVDFPRAPRLPKAPRMKGGGVPAGLRARA